MTDKLDILLTHQQHQATQLLKLLERSGEHGAKLSGLAASVDTISADLAVVRGHPSSCPARQGFATLSRDLGSLQAETAANWDSITATRLKSFTPNPAGGLLPLPKIGALRKRTPGRVNITTMIIYIITVAAAIAAALLGINIQ